MSDDKSKINYGRGSQGMSRPKIPTIPKREFVAWNDEPTPISDKHSVEPQAPQRTRTRQEAFAEAERLLEQASHGHNATKKRPKQRYRALTITMVVLALMLFLMIGMLWIVSEQLRPSAGDLTKPTMMLALLRNVNPAQQNTFNDTTTFEVMTGWSANRVAQELQNQGLVQNSRLFGYFLRWQGSDTKIGEGLYELSPSMNPWQLAEVLEQGGQARTYSILIPEGYRASEVASSLEEQYQGQVEDRDFLWHIRSDDALRPSFIDANVTTGLEGYLFPARYDFVHNTDIPSVVRTMLDRFAQELDDDTLLALETINMSIHDWVTLASMVQSEAGDVSQMPVIAGVFHNRLERGMMLQSDPTVAYGLNKPMNQLNASAGDFTADADHPWNTYTRTGLPLGPISNPGHDALQAVLNPVRQNNNGQDWLYFLHDRDGGFHPNLSLADHNADVQRYLR